jgi:hypothetical protein
MRHYRGTTSIEERITQQSTFLSLDDALIQT